MVNPLTPELKEDSYLYGFSLKNLATYPYYYVLVIKLLLAGRLLEQLLLEDSDNTARIRAICKAQSFNREMLRELGYSYKDIHKLLELHKKDLGNLISSGSLNNALTHPSLLQQSKEYIQDLYYKFIKGGNGA